VRYVFDPADVPESAFTVTQRALAAVLSVESKVFEPDVSNSAVAAILALILSFTVEGTITLEVFVPVVASEVLALKI